MSGLLRSGMVKPDSQPPMFACHAVAPPRPPPASAAAAGRSPACAVA